MKYESIKNHQNKSEYDKSWFSYIVEQQYFRTNY
jgi:hypothetical protein